MLVGEKATCYALWMLMTFLCEGGHFVVFPAVSSNIYGPELGSVMYSLLFLSMGAASDVGWLMTNFLLAAVGNWWYIFIIFDGMTCVSLVLLVMFKVKPKPVFPPFYYEGGVSSPK